MADESHLLPDASDAQAKKKIRNSLLWFGDSCQVELETKGVVNAGPRRLGIHAVNLTHYHSQDCRRSESDHAPLIIGFHA